MKRAWIAVPVVAAALVEGGLASAAARPLPLHAYVGDPAKIWLRENGKPVKKLRAGKYLVVVEDSAADHDFHLTGPGVNRRTSVDGEGTVSWKLTLRRGTYVFVCDPHSSFMRGSFTVT